MARGPGPSINPIPPKARAFQGLRAGVVTRTLAGAVDYLVVVATTLGCYVAVVVLAFLVDPRSFSLPRWTFGQFLLLGLVLMVVYLTASFRITGRTVGDALLGLRVVGRKGQRLRWSVAFLRAGFCAVVPVGLFWCAVSRENRSIQDVVLRTSVIHDWPVSRAVPALLDVDHRADL
jgi:uncharacterized RDD family membrane protein YckC